ncbi:MAG: hypothetical protein EZS28_042525, partial [Streblomastix strix]
WPDVLIKGELAFFRKTLHINSSVTEEQLKQFFEQVGPVAIVNIPINQNGRNRGIGFVQMKDEISAQKAILNLNGKEFGGQNIRVGFTKPSEKR